VALLSYRTRTREIDTANDFIAFAVLRHLSGFGRARPESARPSEQARSALRGNFTFARAEVQSDLGALTLAGTKFNRFLYDADLQFRYPLRGGIAPYVFVGGGAVTVKHDVTPNEPTFTKGAGKFGVGISYRIPKSNVGLYAEGTTWVYAWDRYGFDRTQFDTTWSGGLSYRFGL
jgi:hypothetical protein